MKNTIKLPRAATTLVASLPSPPLNAMKTPMNIPNRQLVAIRSSSLRGLLLLAAFPAQAQQSFSNFQAASVVVGQANFTSQATIPSQTVTYGPSAVAAIARGGLRARVTSKVNRVAGNANTDTEFGIYLFAKGGTPTSPNPISEGYSAITTDSNPSTWQPVSHTLPIPIGTTHLSVYVYASENIFNNVTGVEFDGHYVDDVKLELIEPENEVEVFHSGAALEDGVSVISSGSTVLGASGTAASFSIRNPGTANITGLAVTKDGAHPGDFTISALSSTNLLPGESSTFTVTFTPGAAEFRTCVLHITSNNADADPFDITLTGTGTSPAPLALAQSAYPKAGDTDINDIFGHSVAVSGNTVVVGVSGDDSSTTGVNSTANESATYSGAAYVYFLSGTTWTQQAFLKAHNTGASDQFGVSVAISGDTIVVGADREDSSTIGVNPSSNESATDGGAAYVFTRSGTTWSQQAYVKASNTEAGDSFGQVVAISGDTIAVGASEEDSAAVGINGNQSDNGQTGSGATYVFVRRGGSWFQQAYLKASNTAGGDDFGVSVAISEDTLVVGAHGEDSAAGGINGNQDDNSSSASGAAYVFNRSGSIWTQQAYLKAGNPGAGDRFGLSVGISGNTIAVGSYYEDSGSTGVNTTPNESSTDAGAVYVFNRSSLVWTQQAYLKANNTGANDLFGRSVAISGDTLVVGATNESSAASGINGSGNNNNSSQAGAAYMFVRNGAAWTQRSYLKASNPGPDNLFGRSVAVSGETLVVGADQEDSSTTGVNSAPNNSASLAGAAYIFKSVPGIPEIRVRYSGIDIDGVSISYYPTVTGEFSDASFTIENTGIDPLELTGTPRVGITGPDAGHFIVSTQPGSPVAALGSTPFVVRFAPTSGGNRSATLTIPNNDSDENPYTILLYGTGISYTTDGDGDGMNDASEFKMASLGFNWQVNQDALVADYYDNANGAGLYTPAQVQTLHTGTPLIARDPISGKFKLTMDWKKSTNLTDFFDFPAPAGSTSTISPDGDIDFEFSVPDNAAFFRLQVE